MKERERILDKNNMILRLEKMTMSQVNENQMSKNVLSKDELSKKTSLQEKGITLIALVVTIIILLILAGVTLNMALSQNGLFSKTQEAAEKYKQAQSDEEEMVRQIATQMYSEYVGATVTGYTPKSSTSGCTVGEATTGDTAQTFNAESISWRGWDFDGNTLRIIGDPTTTKLTLKGPAGYNNGVWAMDHICEELYANGKPGVTATNLKRTDIQKVSTYDYTQYKHNPSDSIEVPNGEATSTLQFGETKSYDNAQYPEMWDKNDKEWTYEWNDNGTITGGDKECTTWEKIGSGEGTMGNNMSGGSGSQTFKQSYYSHSYRKNEFINDEYYNLIFEKSNGDYAGDYWLAGRYVHLFKSCCDFGLYNVLSSEIYILVQGNHVCDSNRKSL